MKHRKNYILLGVLIGLMTVAGALIVSENRPISNNQTDALFSIASDTFVDRIILTNGSESVVLGQEGGVWQVNQSFRADANNLQVLLAVLQQSKIQRPIAEKIKAEWGERLRAEGIKVEVFAGATPVRSFLVGGDPTTSRSYFSDLTGTDIYQMALPGYNSYLPDLFAQPAVYWRDATVFTTTWQTLAGIKVSHPEQTQEDFEIYLKDGFYEVPGINDLDTAKLYQFLDGVTALQVGQFIDSAMNGPVALRVEVSDTDPSKSQVLTIFESLPTDSVYFGKLGAEAAVFDQRQVNLLWVKKSELSQ